MDDRDAFFKTHYEYICGLIEKRRHKWRAVSVMEWPDVSSVLITRVYQQLHHYDQNKPLDRWVNKLVSNAMMNLLRNFLYKDASPCVSGQAPGFNMGSSYGRGCACYLGEGRCSWTKSGECDTSCRFYAAWRAKKESKHALNATLSLEHHADEHHSLQDDFLDIEAAKKVIDENIKRRLTKEEYRIYVYMYVKHLSIEETIKKMGFKKAGKNDMKPYTKVRTAALKAKETAKAIISEQSLVR